MALQNVTNGYALRPSGIIGPWSNLGIASAITDLPCAISGQAAQPSYVTMPAAGYIRGFVGDITITDALSTLTCKIFKAGASFVTEIVPTATATKTGSYASGTYAFAAGDKLDMRLTTTGLWTSVTSAFAGWILVEFTP